MCAARDRIEVVDAVVAQANTILAEVESGARQMQSVQQSQAARRLAFVSDVLTEIATGERTLSVAQTKIEDHRAAIDRLLQELERL